MSKKLDINKSLDSISAVRDFKLECLGDYDYKVTANVKVFRPDDDENTIHNVHVDVHVDIGTNFHRISIMWEQVLGEEFKRIDDKLYGIYSTDYNEMSYNYKELTIHSDDRQIIIQV